MSLNLTQEEISILSDAMLNLIHTANKAMEFVADAGVLEELKAVTSKYASLNAKLCQFMQDEQDGQGSIGVAVSKNAVSRQQKKHLQNFLDSNAIMIDSLMDAEEQLCFKGGVVAALLKLI